MANFFSSQKYIKVDKHSLILCFNIRIPIHTGEVCYLLFILMFNICPKSVSTNRFKNSPSPINSYENNN